MITAINQLHGDNLWQLLATHVLRPAHPFAVHQLLARAVFGGQPHPTLWTPTDVASTNLARFMRSGYTVCLCIGEYNNDIHAHRARPSMSSTRRATRKPTTPSFKQPPQRTLTCSGHSFCGPSIFGGQPPP